MLIKRLRNIGGFKTINRYISMLAGYTSYAPSTSSNVIAVPSGNSPYVLAFPWTSGTGFGTKYSDPSTSVSGSPSNMDFSRTKSLLALSLSTSPYINVYPWDSGFGTKYTSPLTAVPNSAKGVSVDIDGQVIAVGHTASPGVSVYQFSDYVGFGTKYSNPASLPTNGIAVKINLNYLFVGDDTTPFIKAYPFDSVNGIGVKYADPATIPGYSNSSLDYSVSANAVTIGGIGYSSVYPWSVSGFGTKYANAAEGPYGYGLKFNLDGNTIAIGAHTSPYIFAYPWSVSGFGTKYSNPATLPTAQAPYNTNAVDINFDSTDIGIMTTASPYAFVYPFTVGTGFGTKYSNPGTLSAGGSFIGGINFN